MKCIFLLFATMVSATAVAKTIEYKVLELDQNEIGPYALFSGGELDGLVVGDEICVQKNSSKDPVFCSKIVNIRKRAAAFYIPAGYQADVQMGTLVTFESKPEAKNAPEIVAPASTEVQSNPWFLPAQHINAGYHLQITSALKAKSISFSALPRDNNNEPWIARDALNLAPLGFGFGYSRDFLEEGNHIGVRGFYGKSMPASFDNDYDLSDTTSHVESAAATTTLGLAVFYGTERNIKDDLGYSASGGLGIRRRTVAVTSNLNGTSEMTLVSASVIATAPIIEFATGARYKLFGVNWTADLMIGIPLSLKSKTSGTFNSFQDVTSDDVQTNITDAVGSTKDVEISLGLGLIRSY